MWQLITVAPNSEARVSRILDEGLEVDALAFRIKRQTVVRGKIVFRRVAAFPGYIFVSGDASFDEIRSVIGVFDFVRIGSDIAEIAASIVDNLLDLALDDGTLPLGEEPVSTRFRSGDRVLIRNLNFDAIGVFQSLEANDRAIVLLDWFGRSVPASVAESDLTLDNRENQRDIPRPSRIRRRRRVGKRERLLHRERAGRCTTEPTAVSFA